MSILMRRSGGRPSYFSDIFKYYCDNLLSMNSKEFIQALDEGKTLVSIQDRYVTAKKLTENRQVMIDNPTTGVHLIGNYSEKDSTETLVFLSRDNGTPYGTAIGFVNAEKWEVKE